MSRRPAAARRAAAFAVRAHRVLRKPPRVVARRLADEAVALAERPLAPRRAARLRGRVFLAAVAAPSLDVLWERLAARPFPAHAAPLDRAVLDAAAPGEHDRVLEAAERALARELDLLGSGPFALGRPADWLRDPVSGRRWEPGWARGIEYANLGEPSDVKLPWEISRLQWLIPAGQAYLLTGDERYAAEAAALLDEWIAGNPHARTVNWSVTMEPALRLLTWTWLFHAFHGSASWRDPGFRARFLAALYMHGDYTARNLERSDVNGNHYTADAAGLVFAGLFFGAGRGPQRWLETGWRILEDELPRQVHPDGVDFEASTAYHRLVAELFLLPARYRLALGLDVSSRYRERLLAMAAFTEAYLRPDGTAPHWGDEDDARALPFGGQALDDHRYLPSLIRATLADEPADPAAAAEWLWVLGPDASTKARTREVGPAGFPDGGAFVLRGPDDHVFVDCGPVGLAGRGGHGHNDVTALDATLAGTPLLVDPGSYVYTSSPEWRNRFRATAAHNAVQLDGEELNRLGEEGHLWSLREDARPVGASVFERGGVQVFRGGHTGYERLPSPVRVRRTAALDPEGHRLVVVDELDGNGEHDARVRWLLAPGAVLTVEHGTARIEAAGRVFAAAWSDDWQGAAARGWFSPSYGVRVEVDCLELTRSGPLRPQVCAFGAGEDAIALRAWAQDVRGRLA
jgi:hypothetical protein